jgi:hypothetical protein
MEERLYGVSEEDFLAYEDIRRRGILNMLSPCENCGQTQNHPPYLWKVAHYVDKGQKVICPACAHWLRVHPEAGRIIGGVVA